MNDDQSRPAIVDLDLAVYRLASIKKAAYKFGGRCHVRIEALAEDKVRVTLTPKRLLESIGHLTGEFQNEVLDQELREDVAAETAGVRNLIIAQAYSQTSLLDRMGETADYHTDPLGISRPDAAHNDLDPDRK
jgi:His-Xaa-Ser system protein HxsD